MNLQMNPLKFTNSGMRKITVPVTGFIRNSLLTPCLRIFLCCLIPLLINGCVGGVVLPFPGAEELNEGVENIFKAQQTKRASAHQEEMVAYEAQRAEFEYCSPELREVRCSETLRNQKKVEIKLLVVPGPGDKRIRRALENVVPISDHKTRFASGTKYMYTTTDYKHMNYRFRLYKRWEDWLWDLEIRYFASDPENLQRAISIMVSRFREVIR